jgi:hypothetical protein
VSRPLAAWDRPNVQAALDGWLRTREVEVIGLPPSHGYRAGLAELVRGGEYVPDVEPGGVEDMTVPLGEDETITCPRSGLWLVRDDDGRLALMVKSVDHGMGRQLELEAMAERRAFAEAVLARLSELMSERNVYRARVLELRPRHFHGDEAAPLTVRSLPPIARERIVLPEGVLEQIERQAFAVTRHADRRRTSTSSQWIARSSRPTPSSSSSSTRWTGSTRTMTSCSC